MKIGVIGGTGFYSIEGEKIEIETDYGKVETIHFKKYGRDIFFISRHGKNHEFPAHRVRYHANIMAMKNIGVEAIIGVSTVGSMKKSIKPGSIFVPDDFIDFTGRQSTFFNDVTVHIDMTIPFCPVIRKLLVEKARKYVEVNEGIYVATNGPRLETKAEIRMFSKFGDVVGMTLVPEAILAREQGICYASLCVVSNYAAGMQERLSIDEIKRVYQKLKPYVDKIVDEAIRDIPDNRDCNCKNAAEEGRL